MTSLTDDENLLRLKEIKWKSNLTRRVEEFRSVISNDDDFDKYFGKEYVEKLTEKSARISRLNLKLFTMYFVVMLALYASQSLKGEELRILGYSFKNIGSYKELILFIAVILSPISAVLSAYKKYIDALIKECIVKISPDENIRSFYRHFWVDEYSDALFKKRITEKNIFTHGFTTFIGTVIAGVLILVTMTVLLSMFFVQLVVIYDVAINPISTGYFNKFVIIFALSSIVLSWLITIVQLPMPEVDYGNLDKLTILKTENPTKYKSTMDKIALQYSKKEARLVLFISAISYLITFSCISFIWYRENLEQVSIFLPKAMIGAFFVMFFSNEFLEFIRKIFNRMFFLKYPEESELRLIKFKKINKVLKTLSFLIPILLTGLYSLYTYQ